MGPIPQDLTTVWPKLMPGAILWLDGGLFFASACANNVGLEITIVSLVVFWIVNFVSMLALLVVRRRHGLIIHGLKSGFFVSQEQPVDELVAPTAKANVDLTRDVADLSAQPRHESMIVPSLSKKWDPSCTMINEAAPHFSRAEHIIEMFDFFHNPLEARVFAAVFGVSRICASALDMTVLYSASMLIAPGLNPVYLMCAAVLMSFALRALPRSSLSSLECTLTGALIVGTFAAFLLHGAAVGFAWDPLHHRRISRHQAPHEWYYAVIAATCLTFERHSSVAEYFVAEHRPRSPTDPPVDSLSKNPNFTGPNAKRTLNGLTALMGFKFVVTVLFVVLGYLVVPHYHGHKGTPFSLARKLDVSTIGAQIAWWAAVLCPPWINVVGHVGAPRQAVAAFRYALTGARYDWEPSRISIAWAVPVLAFAMSLSLSSDGLAWWVVPGYRIGSVFFSAVAPFVVLRCSRMCARRLGIPRRLDDALRVPPFIRRLCTTVGVACVLVITAGALGWFNTA